MRIVLLAFFVLFSFRPFAQTNLAKQIKNIIADSSHDFRNYKSSFLSLQDKDSVFGSLITIGNTIENDIFYSDEMVIYRATIADSVRIKEAKKIVDEWKDSLKEILADEFSMKPVKVVEWNPSQYGWTFERGEVIISVDLFSRGLNSKMYLVSIGISRFNYNSIIHKLK